MTNGNLVKLYVYQHETNETIVDTYSAKTWEDFLIVYLKKSDVSMQDIDNLRSLIIQSENWKDKQVLLIPEGADIEFYGIRAEPTAMAESVYRMGEGIGDTDNSSSLHILDTGAGYGAE